ncbi:11812_t:CDS:2 [Diversispora eburnea]|uniref:11812_t:CDS:1 n=1 Tax=Diversispora eburnea TaxID=1213867 RepID=A0A9N9B4Q4_9GLOM|nr:11812_t:CDS:2 [Diversispora eburnea]
MANLILTPEKVQELLNKLSTTEKALKEAQEQAKLLLGLARDFTKLLEVPKDHNVSIKVGKEPNVEIFNVHSGILRTRSSYFDVAFSNKWVNKDKDNVILFQKENITPKIFQIILRYLYGGFLELNEISPEEVFDLLKACDEFCLEETIDFIQDFLLEKHKSWIKNNFFSIHRLCSEFKSFSKLENYCTRFINN